MDRTELVTAESHGILLVGRKASNGLGEFGLSGKEMRHLELTIHCARWAERYPTQWQLNRHSQTKPPMFRTFSAHRVTFIVWNLRIK